MQFRVLTALLAACYRKFCKILTVPRVAFVVKDLHNTIVISYLPTWWNQKAMRTWRLSLSLMTSMLNRKFDCNNILMNL